ncbi:MAG: hypothetical protein R6V50_08445 [Thermoplasmatota archaeon]
MNQEKLRFRKFIIQLVLLCRVKRVIFGEEKSYDITNIGCLI